MRQILTLLAIFVFSTGFSQTQLEINQKAEESYRLADKELNSVYQKILVKYKTDTTFLNNLKTSQRIWITFRDAELKARFSEKESGYYGSMLPMCEALCSERLTKERTIVLKKYLENRDWDGCN